MNTDRELLQLAAKAAGFYVKGEVVNQDDEFIGLRVKPGISAPRVTIAFWNPLTDDGDAFRLAVKLGMAVSVCLGMPCESFTAILGSGFDSEKHKDDPYAATRRAIVRAAAEIGLETP